MVMTDGRDAIAAMVTASIQALQETTFDICALAWFPHGENIPPTSAQGAEATLQRWERFLAPFPEIRPFRVRHHQEVHNILRTLGENTYLVFYLSSTAVNNRLDLSRTLESLSGTGRPPIAGLTLIIDDSSNLGELGAKRLGYLDYMEWLKGNDHLVEVAQQIGCPMRVLVVGVWDEAFGHPGSYVVGCPVAVELLSVQADLAAHSSPPSPVQAAMTLQALRELQGQEL